MIFGVADEVWIVSLGTVSFNAVISLLINSVTAKKAYKRGYEAAQTANEALALGRLFEASRERYYAGDALARALEDSVESRDATDPEQ